MSSESRRKVSVIVDQRENFNDQTIPQQIREDYVDDFNIEWVHKIVMKSMSNEAAKCEQFRNEVNMEKKRLVRAYTIIDKNMIRSRIRKMESHLAKYENGTLCQEYINRATDYILLYRKLQPKYTKMKFEKEQEKTSEEENLVEDRCAVIFGYLEIAKDYYDIDVRRIKLSNTKCKVCGESTEGVVEDNGVIRCICGAVQQYYSDSTTQSDASRPEPTRAKSTPQDRANFEKAFDSYNCRQEDKIPSSLYKAMDNYLVSYGKPTCADIRAMPLNSDGRSRGKTSILMLENILRAIGYTDYYDYGRLILYKAWGWVFEDISHMKAKIMEDYDLTQKAFVELPNKGRTSSPNRYYRLFRHLQANGHPCTIDDFRIVKTEKTRENLDILWVRMCKASGYPPILRYR